jgi:hypothetical protein
MRRRSDQREEILAAAVAAARRWARPSRTDDVDIALKPELVEARRAVRRPRDPNSCAM